MSKDIQKIGTRGDDDDHPHGDIERRGESVLIRKLAFRVFQQNLKESLVDKGNPLAKKMLKTAK